VRTSRRASLARAPSHRESVGKHRYLVANVQEILDIGPDEDEHTDGAAVDRDAARKGKSAVVKTTSRSTVFLPAIGLVHAEELKPDDLVGVNKDSFIVLSKLPVECVPSRPGRAQGCVFCARTSYPYSPAR
jgi:ATP-dependent 26S proteasome regulatory subunit